MSKINILITGACGVTSRSLARSLYLSDFFKDKINLIGADVCYNLYGAFEGLYSKVYKVPSYNDSEYDQVINDIIKKEKIEYAFVIPEPEVKYWCERPFNVKFHKIPFEFAKKVISKLSLYNLLRETNLVPKFQIIKKDIEERDLELNFPMWVRDYSEGTTSGLGSFCPKNFNELKGWLEVNSGIKTFMISEYLPGRNLACFLLYDKGNLIKYGVGERLDYIMAKVSVSKITGNTSRGKLLNDKEPFKIAEKAVDQIKNLISEDMNGLIVVDLKEDDQGEPKITEINIRHVAFTSSFAKAGLNFAETQLYILTENNDKISKEKTIIFPSNNLILRDVDGMPIYIDDFHDVKIGEAYNNCTKAI